MKAEERKIAKRDMEFLQTYANKYYPLHDSLYDFEEAIRATEGFDRAQNILIKQRDSLINKQKKARKRLLSLNEKYGRRVFEIVSEFDGYTN